MKVFSVAYFSRGGSKRNSKGSSSSSSGLGSTSATLAAVPGHGHGGGGRSRDDRPFPSPSAAMPGGAYVISPPPRYYEAHAVAAQASHTLQFVRAPAAQHRGRGGGGGGAAWRGSNPDLRRMNNSGFTIYDDDDAALSALSRGRRRGSSGAGEKGLRSMKNPFQRSRSTSGGRRSGNHHGSCSAGQEDVGFVWPAHFYPAVAANNSSAAVTPSSEPIYSEPLPPITLRVREAEKKVVLKQSAPATASPAFSPDPACDSANISNHIYEYLVTRRSDASTQMAADGGVNLRSAKVAPATLPKPAPQSLAPRAESVPRPVTRRRGSLSSSSPSSSAASSSSKRDSQDSHSGKDHGKSLSLNYFSPGRSP